MMRRLLIIGATLAPTAAFAQGTDDGSLFLGFAILGGAIALYFLPAIIASNRGVNASVVLFFLNLFLGWTVIGWIVCLIWAASGATKAQDQFYKNAAATSSDAYARERARLDHEAGRR